MKKYYKYVDDVLKKKIVVCDMTYKAVLRFARDLEKKEFIFNEQEADKIISFIETLKFTEQDYLDKNFILEDWQSFIVANIFGWKTKEGNRRFKKAFVFVARGNGKSPLASAIVLANMLVEAGAQVYSIATNYSQSAIIYNYIKNFILKDETLQRIFTIYSHSIENKIKVSIYRPLSKTFKGFDGFNPSMVVADEVSAMEDYNLLNMFTTAMHKRVNSLLFMITTANFINENAPGRVEYNYSCQILNNIVKDENYFSILYEIDKHDDYRDEKCYIKANPAHFVNLDILKKMRVEAENKKEMLNSFQTKNLNRWVLGSANEFVSFDIISKCVQNYEKYKHLINDELLKTCRVSIGADFSDRRDLTSITFAFYIEQIDKIYLKHFIFTSSTELWRRTEAIRSLYDNFKRDNEIIECEGNYIDKQLVLYILLENIKKYCGKKRPEFYFDEYGSVDFIDVLGKSVVPIVVKQNLLSISEYTKDYRELLENEKIIDGNKCAIWQLQNCRIYSTNNLEKLNKENKQSEKKIDTCMSSLMALIGIKKHLMDKNFKKLKQGNEVNVDNLISQLKSIYF